MKAGELGVWAQILSRRSAELTVAAGAVEPRNTDAVTSADARDLGSHGINFAHNLMTWDDRQFRQVQLALDSMQVRVAYSARPHPDADLAGAGLWDGDAYGLEGVRCHWLWGGEKHSVHTSHGVRPPLKDRPLLGP